MLCPKCGRTVDTTAFLCPFCEYILDTSFLGDDITDDDSEFRVKSDGNSKSSAPRPHPTKTGLFAEDAMILGNPSEEDFSDFESSESGVRREVTNARFYVDASTAALTHPDAVLEIVPAVAAALSAQTSLSPFEQHVLAFINGKRSVGRIGRKSGLDATELKTTLALLGDKGVVRLRTMKKRKPKAPLPAPIEADRVTEDQPIRVPHFRSLMAQAPVQPAAPPASVKRTSLSSQLPLAPGDDGDDLLVMAEREAQRVIAAEQKAHAQPEPEASQEEPIALLTGEYAVEDFGEFDDATGMGSYDVHKLAARSAAAVSALATQLPADAAPLSELPTGPLPGDHSDVNKLRDALAGELGESLEGEAFDVNLQTVALPEFAALARAEVPPAPPAAAAPVVPQPRPVASSPPAPSASAGTSAPAATGAATGNATGLPRAASQIRPAARSTATFEQARKAERIFEQAQKDQTEGRLSSARMNAKLAMQFDPSVPLYKEFYDLLQAQGPLQAKATARPREVELFEQAAEAEGRGQYERAADFLRKAIAVNGNAAALHNRLGVVLSIRLKRHDEALKHLKLAVDLEPGSPVYMNNFSKVAALLESQLGKDPDAHKPKRAQAGDKVDLKKVRPKIY